MKGSAWAAVIVLVTVALFASPVLFAQHSFTGGTGVTESDTAPSDQGLVWVRNSDRQSFVYNDSLGKWLGELQRVTFDRNANLVTGFIRYGGNGVVSDTTTGAEIGFYADGAIRLMKATSISSSATPNCTTFVYSDQTLAAKLVWGGAKTIWTPTADSTGGWIAPSDRVVIADTDIMSVSLVPASLPDNPSNPVIEFYFREEVTP